MRYSTGGIVLTHFKYSESSVIARVLTQDFGLQSYIVKGVRSKKSKSNLNLLRPLSLIDLEAFVKSGKEGGLHQLISFSSSSHSVEQDFGKKAIAMFVAEVLLKSIEEGDPNPEFFKFVSNSVEVLERSESYLNYHVVFMLNLTRYLGFSPNIQDAKQGTYFNVVEGVFVRKTEHTKDCMSLDASSKLYGLLGLEIADHQVADLSLKERNALIDELLLFFNAQIPNMQTINSHLILREVMN